ncbi:MAG: alkaline phosphatase family protein [Actinomycetota bacterium]|nr:alkaline phosphatase family protein [Actinomycetota bacterium]
MLGDRPERRNATAILLGLLIAGACTQGSPNNGNGGPTTSGASSSTPASPTSSSSGSENPNAKGIFKLDHLIFVVQENRSFDEYFGTFPGADGIPAKHGKFTVCVPDPVLNKCVPPYHNPYLRGDGGPHAQPDAITDINGGKMDGFIQSVVDSPNICANDRFSRQCKTHIGPQGQPGVMGYHDAREIPNYWTYAQNFVLQDHMFSAADSWTFPSHLYLVSGWAATCPDVSDPMSCYSDVALGDTLKVQRGGPQKPIYAWTDITYLLNNANVSWAYYVGDGTCIDACGHTTKVPGSTVPAQNPLPGFVDVHEDHQLQNVQEHTHYFDAAANGSLPSVSWVVPGRGYTEHPGQGDSLAPGQTWVTRVVNAAMQGPDWNSTAIFVTWDEWGGFYDHVQPPSVNTDGYGIRVPGMVISPYAKKGYIDHQTLSHDAYLKLIEDRFLHGQRLDPKTDGRPDARPSVRENLKILGDLRKDFDFSQPPRPPMILDEHPAPGPPSKPGG